MSAKTKVADVPLFAADPNTRCQGADPLQIKIRNTHLRWDLFNANRPPPPPPLIYIFLFPNNFKKSRDESHLPYGPRWGK